MAERVVDLLEAVEVEQHHAELLVVRLRVAIRSSSRARKRSRLASPVSSSVVAIRWSSSPRCLDFRSSPTRYWKMQEHERDEHDPDGAELRPRHKRPPSSAAPRTARRTGPGEQPLAPSAQETSRPGSTCSANTPRKFTASATHERRRRRPGSSATSCGPSPRAERCVEEQAGDQREPRKITRLLRTYVPRRAVRDHETDHRADRPSSAAGPDRATRWRPSGRAELPEILTLLAPVSTSRENAQAVKHAEHDQRADAPPIEAARSATMTAAAPASASHVEQRNAAAGLPCARDCQPWQCSRSIAPYSSAVHESSIRQSVQTSLDTTKASRAAADDRMTAKETEGPLARTPPEARSTAV